MKRIFILLLVIGLLGFGYRNSVKYRIYVNKEGRDWSYLVLSDDHKFYQLESWGNCDYTDDYYSKGIWKVENGYLELEHFDSIHSLPVQTIIETNASERQDTISVILEGIMKQPPEMHFVLYKPKINDLPNPEYEYDNNGVLKISRDRYSSFYMYRDMKNSLVNPSEIFKVFSTKDAPDSIIVRFDWPIIGRGSTNHLTKTVNRYKIYGSKIYDLKGKLEYTLHDVEIKR